MSNGRILSTERGIHESDSLASGDSWGVTRVTAHKKESEQSVGVTRSSASLLCGRSSSAFGSLSLLPRQHGTRQRDQGDAVLAAWKILERCTSRKAAGGARRCMQHASVHVHVHVSVRSVRRTHGSSASHGHREPLSMAIVLLLCCGAPSDNFTMHNMFHIEK